MGFLILGFRIGNGRKGRKRRSRQWHRPRTGKRRKGVFDARLNSRRTAWGGQGKESKLFLKNFSRWGKWAFCWGFWGTLRCQDSELYTVRMGKRGIAKGYLGTQGTGDETGAVDESEKPLSCGEDMESDCKRLGIKSVNSAFESLKGRIA